MTLMLKNCKLCHFTVFSQKETASVGLLLHIGSSSGQSYYVLCASSLAARVVRGQNVRANFDPHLIVCDLWRIPMVDFEQGAEPTTE